VPIARSLGDRGSTAARSVGAKIEPASIPVGRACDVVAAFDDAC
jgi:hypothetical protein